MYGKSDYSWLIPLIIVVSVFCDVFNLIKKFFIFKTPGWIWNASHSSNGHTDDHYDYTRNNQSNSRKT